MSVRLYYHGRCRTCRRALGLLREKGADVEVVEYLADPPAAEEWRRVLRLYDGEPADLLRRRDPLFAELKLGEQDLGADRVARVLGKHPQLLARPVAMNGKRVVVGRPAERVLDVLP